MSETFFLSNVTLKKYRSKKKEWAIRPEFRERMDKEMAAHYVSERFPVVPDTWNVGEVHAYISQNSLDFDTLDYIYVVNSAQKLVGVVSIRDIFSHPKKMELKHVMKREIVTVSPETRREKIAKLALQHNLRAIPIVKNQKLEGVIETNKILHIINRALHEHILTFGGVHRSHLEYEDTMHIPVLTSISHRLPWLLVGLAGVIFAAGIIDQFEAVLDTHIIFAFFIPAILYMSNALGTQNQTLLIRDLALMGKEIKTVPYAFRTLVISLFISLCIGGLVFLAASTLWGDARASGIIALAMSLTLMISASSSLATTFLFQKMKMDPALGSGPFATIISDVSSIIVYFVIVSALLG